MIDSLRGDKKAPLEMLFFCRKLRGQVAFLGVEQKLSQKENNVDEDIMRCLKTSLEDLRFCSNYLDQFSFGTDRALKLYHVWHDQATANLTLAEVELILGKRKGATKHLADCRGMIDRMTEARSRGVKMPEPSFLAKRLTTIQEQLDSSEVGLTSGRSDSARRRDSKEIPRSG